MRWSTVRRSTIVYLTLLGVAAAICGWQVEEHLRFKRTATQALVNRGYDITATLGAMIRAQRRNNIVFNKTRFESALQDLVQPDGLKAIAILGSTGEPIASAGQTLDLTPEFLSEPGPYWHDGTLMLLNILDLDPNVPPEEGGFRRPAAIVVNEGMERAFRERLRRPPWMGRGNNSNPGGRAPATPPPGPPTLTPGAPSGGASAPGTTPAPAGATEESPAAATTASPGALDANAPVPSPETAATPPFPGRGGWPSFNRPFGMTSEEYEALIKRQGVHSFVVAMAGTDMERAVRGDLLLRSLVSVLAVGAALISALAWRNLAKSSELQIRLVKAGEMNTHLKEMNFAAAGLAHETRNPLNLIRGFAQMIAIDPQGSSKLKEHASTIIEEADRVAVQLNEFIDYSKPREAHLAPVAVARLVADVARTLVPDMEEKHVTLRPPDTTLTIDADEQLLRQALFNILLNAVQAVGPGGKIDVRLTQTGPREAMLEVDDDGPGVPEENRATIFKPYVTLREKGVGLGLAIVQQIVSAHHWAIACEANAPRGARFRISGLKLAAAP